MKNQTTENRFAPRELATVLAALRFWQDRHQPDGLHPRRLLDVEQVIAREHGPELDVEEIDALCERLNGADEKDEPFHLDTFRRFAGSDLFLRRELERAGDSGAEVIFNSYVLDDWNMREKWNAFVRYEKKGRRA